MQLKSKAIELQAEAVWENNEIEVKSAALATYKLTKTDESMDGWKSVK